MTEVKVRCISVGDEWEYRGVVLDFIVCCEHHLRLNTNKNKELVVDFCWTHTALKIFDSFKHLCWGDRGPSRLAGPFSRHFMTLWWPLHCAHSHRQSRKGQEEVGQTSEESQLDRTVHWSPSRRWWTEGCCPNWHPSWSHLPNLAPHCECKPFAALSAVTSAPHVWHHWPGWSKQGKLEWRRAEAETDTLDWEGKCKEALKSRSKSHHCTNLILAAAPALHTHMGLMMQEKNGNVECARRVNSHGSLELPI